MASICVIGMWHLGCVSAACLARDHQVAAWDFDRQIMEGLRGGKPPIFEPGLQEEIGRAMGEGRLKIASGLGEAVLGADVVWITFDTPVDQNDELDLSPILNAVDGIIPLLSDGQLLVVSSQVPVGTSRKIYEKIRKAGKKVEVCYSPENLRLGNAISCFMKPERVVLGISGEEAKGKVADVFAGIGGERLWMGLESAEMSKHALNSYLATLISFSGEISDLCERTGANAIHVMESLRKERRVSPDAPIMPGLGFGGGTLARDVQVLRSVGRGAGVATHVLDAVLASNRERVGYVEQRLESALGGLGGKAIAFFGLTYKPGTDTLRRSLALDVIEGMGGRVAQVRAYDPAIKGAIEGKPHVLVCKSAEEAATGADAIVITTAWEEFKKIDYGKLAGLMRTPVVVDARNALANQGMPPGVRYFGVGVSYGK